MIIQITQLEKENYTGEIKKTGYYDINNIYDMAGNVWECIMKDYSNENGSRGGSYSNYCPASERGCGVPNHAGSNVGFRVALYIKETNENSSDIDDLLQESYENGYNKGYADGKKVQLKKHI